MRPRCQNSRYGISYKHCCPVERMFQGGRQHKRNSGTVTLLCNVKKKTNHSWKTMSGWGYCQCSMKGKTGCLQVTDLLQALALAEGRGGLTLDRFLICTKKETGLSTIKNNTHYKWVSFCHSIFFPWKFNRADRDCQINCLKFTYLSQGSWLRV